MQCIKWLCMVLTTEEESLIQVVRALPPDEARRILTGAEQLADLAQDRDVEWSDSWTDEDQSDATAASIRNFEEREQESG